MSSEGHRSLVSSTVYLTVLFFSYIIILFTNSLMLITHVNELRCGCVSGVLLSISIKRYRLDLSVGTRAVNIAIKYRNTWYRRYFFDVFSVSQRVSR